ncbi:MAG: glycosyltransferase family 2 protein [Myxococcales bacterium]|nr:glycosyltransferase family 2 protein [Myxococcales bacterium]
MNRREPPSQALPAAASFLYVNQCTDIEPPDVIDEGPVRMHSFAERGLSRSRNRAIALSRAELLVLADDDVEHPAEMVERVRRGFDAHPRASVVTFQFLDAASGEPVKSYRRDSFVHDRRSVGSVSSIEIGLRRERLAGLRFDERLGLGSGLPTGEEFIFLMDALRAGHVLGYWPEPICSHPGVGGGHRDWDAFMVRAKGAVLRRGYPLAWPLAIAYFALTKRSRYGRAMGPAAFLYHATRGARVISP